MLNLNPQFREKVWSNIYVQEKTMQISCRMCLHWKLNRLIWKCNISDRYLIFSFSALFTRWQKNTYMDGVKRVHVCMCVYVHACVVPTVCGSAPGLAEREQISTVAWLELNEELCLKGCCHFQRALFPLITGHLSSSLAKIKRSLRLNSLRKWWYFWITFIIRTDCKPLNGLQGSLLDCFFNINL